MRNLVIIIHNLFAYLSVLEVVSEFLDHMSEKKPTN